MRKIVFPVNPTLDTTFHDTGLGPVGILKSGAWLFNHLSNTNGQDDVAYHIKNELVSLDSCSGHAAPGCWYHLHGLFAVNGHACSFKCRWDQCDLIGYMLDGFPIYSHCKKNDGKWLKSCYKLKDVILGPQEFVIDIKSDKKISIPGFDDFNPTLVLAQKGTKVSIGLIAVS